MSEKELLYKNIQCKAYLKKRNTKFVMANEIDEHYEDNMGIKLSFGESTIQDIYELKEKSFNGVCVGICTIATKREYTYNFDDIGDQAYIDTFNFEPIKVAKVFYQNNRCRLVPFEFIENLNELLGDEK